MSKYRQPLRTIKSNSSGSAAIMLVASPPHFFFSGIEGPNNSLAYSTLSNGLTLLIAKLREGIA